MDKHKFIICSINSKYIHSSLSAWCLYAGMKKYAPEIDAHVIEGTINEKYGEVANRIISQKPNTVGFSCYIWNLRQSIETAALVKNALPKVKIIFGGPEVSYNQSEVLNKYPAIDFIVSGEGEKALAQAVKAISENQPPKAGLASYCQNGNVVLGDYQIYNEELSPYCEEYFHKLGGRIAYIESSRGCPYSCAFCLSGDDKSVRFFDIEKVKKEILLLAASGTETVKFVDRTFNCNKNRASEILLFIKEHYNKEIPNSVCFHFEIAADILDDELVSIISQMPNGSVQFEVGIQSFNSITLEKINRKTNLIKLCDNVKKLVKMKNCHIHIDLIAGLPYENYESFKNSFNKAFELKANMLQLGFLKILHGSCMEKEADLYITSYLKEPPYEVIETPWISKEELVFLHKVEDVLERLYNSGRFKRSLAYILKAMNKTPFDIFSDAAIYLDKISLKNPSLDLYTEHIFEYFSSLECIDKAILRDKMITDRILTNSSGIIPKCLQIKDERLKKAKYYLSKVDPQNTNVMRSVAIIYSENTVLYCDYAKKDRVSGEYAAKYCYLNNILE